MTATDRASKPTAEQLTGLGDMAATDFRAALHEVADLMADYVEGIESRPVLPPIEPGSVAAQLPTEAPEEPEPLDAILDDYRRLVEPNATHWSHPGFLAYFASTPSAPGVIGEMLTAVLGQNAMLWRTSPVGTELEGVVVGWLRRAFGLPDAFDGLLTDSASTSTLVALAGAREAIGVDAVATGLAREDPLPRLRVYASEHAHSSVEKACMTLGLGRAALVPIPANERFELLPDALEVAIARDRAAGLLPVAIVATVGTTSSTSVDPVAAVADIAAREGIWLHVDAAYAGATAILPERRTPFDGWERADSIVVNPHKWLFTPLDASLLLTRRMDRLEAAFSLHPEYLRTLDRATPVRDYTDFIPQLGRRMRALKLWMQLRWFGLEGMRRRIRHHLDLAGAFAEAVDREPDWQRLAPVPFSTVCFRWRPATLEGRDGEPDVIDRLDRANAAIMDAVNRSGEAFLSHTRLNDAFTIRLAIGNLRTEQRHVDRTWDLLRAAAREHDIA